MLLLTNLKTTTLALAAGLAIGGFTGWHLTARYKDAQHEAQTSALAIAASEQLLAATVRVAEVERQHAALAAQLEADHAKAQATIASTLADNRRLTRLAGGLRDPFAAASTCPVSTAPDGTVDPAATATVGRLSAEASEFLLEFAYDADRAAEYASTCYRWVKELKGQP